MRLTVWTRLSAKKGRRRASRAMPSLLHNNHTPKIRCSKSENQIKEPTLGRPAR